MYILDIGYCIGIVCCCICGCGGGCGGGCGWPGKCTFGVHMFPWYGSCWHDIFRWLYCCSIKCILNFSSFISNWCFITSSLVDILCWNSEFNHSIFVSIWSCNCLNFVSTSWCIVLNCERRQISKCLDVVKKNLFGKRIFRSLNFLFRNKQCIRLHVKHV
jgi:hypothetical protein